MVNGHWSKNKYTSISTRLLKYQVSYKKTKNGNKKKLELVPV